MASLYHEYQYRRTFHMGHEAFLDEPRDVIAWMNRIDNIVPRGLDG